MTDRTEKNEMAYYSLNNRDISVSFRQTNVPIEHPLHWHSYIEIELCIGGTAVHNLNGTEYGIENGDVYILRPSDFHSMKSPQSLKLYNISTSETSLSHETLMSLARYPKGVRTKLSGETLQSVKELARLMYKEDMLECRNDTVLQKLLDCFIIKVLESIPSLEPSLNIDTDPISAAVTYINMHFIDNPTLSDAAKAAHYNPSHFSSKFRETVGTTYSEYLNGLKIKYAKRLLLSTELKVSDVAFKSGFASQSHFLKVFKKYTGTSPLKFRTKHREKAL